MNQIITPFEVTTIKNKIDYHKIIHDFGSNFISKSLLKRFESLTGQKPHPLLRRGIYFSHRDFDKILDLYEKKEKFYLFTGRGPSYGSMHIGHIIPFMFTKYMQKVFDCPLVIQINDDEKYFWKDVKLENLNELAKENIKDVISFGFDLNKTFIFLNTEYIKELYPNVCKIQKRVTYNQIKAIFGIKSSDNCGKIAFPAIQSAPSFSSSFKKVFNNKKMQCLILCAIDQDPYFRMTRDVANRLNEMKPALLHCKFVPGLQGLDSKMSASSENSAILLSDSRSAIKKKINKSKSGGRETMDLQRKLGAVIEEDVAFMYLTFFLEDDGELDRIKKEYKNGNMLSGEVKKILIDILAPIVEELRNSRLKVTDDMVKKFTTIRQLHF